MKMKERYKRIIIGISTIILIILMIYFIDFSLLLVNLSKVSFYGILLIILIYTIVFVLRTYRLKLIFKGLNLQSSFLILLGSFGIGWGINELTPGKIGDLARIEFIHQKENNVSLSKSTCGISIERFIDIFILVFFACIALGIMYLNNIKGTTELNLHIYIGIGFFILIGGMVTLLFIAIKTNWVLNLIGKISIKLRNLMEQFLTKFLEGLNDFRKNKRNVLKVIILSIPTWFFETLTLILLFYLIGFEIDIFIIIFAQLITFSSKIIPITSGGWIISENIGALIIFLFYPSIPFGVILAVFILDHMIRTIYCLTFGISSAFAFNFKFENK